MYKVLCSREAQKDAAKIKQSNLAKKCQELIAVLSSDPYIPEPPYEKLTGNLKGLYSRRLNIRYRLIYEADDLNKIVKVLRMWTHNE